MAAPTFDPDRASKILVDAQLLGDETACSKWKISRKTLLRYRARLDGDEQLSRVVCQKKALIDVSWAAETSEAMRATVKRIKTLVESAGVDQLRDVVGAAKVLGDLLITNEALVDDEPEVETTDERPRGPEQDQDSQEEESPSPGEEDIPED